MSWLADFFRLVGWKWRHRCYWFLRKKPHREIRTVIIEGRPGEGKTLFLTKEAHEYMRLGYRVCANYSIRDPVTGQHADKIGDWLDMLRISVEALERQQSVIFVIDEIQLWCNSRKFKDTPDWWLTLVSQRRHYGIGIIGSTINHQRVEIVLREIVDDLVRIRNRTFLRVPLFALEKVDPTSVDRESGYSLTAASWIWMNWKSYKGYDTRELQQMETWKTDAEIEKEVRELTSRAADLVRPGLIPAFADDQLLTSSREWS